MHSPSFIPPIHYQLFIINYSPNYNFSYNIWKSFGRWNSTQQGCSLEGLGRVAPNPVKIKSYKTIVFLKLEPEPKVLSFSLHQTNSR